MIYNQIVTWTAFAILVMFILFYMQIGTGLCWIFSLIRIVKCKIPVALIAWQWTCRPLHWILYKNINTDVLIHKGILGERGFQCVSGTQRRAPSKSKTLNICLGISFYFQVYLLHTILQQVKSPFILIQISHSQAFHHFLRWKVKQHFIAGALEAVFEHRLLWQFGW